MMRAAQAAVPASVTMPPAGRPGPWLRRKPGSALVGDGAGGLFTFDLAGRLIEAWVDGRHYRRGLDNRLMERRMMRAREGVEAPDGLSRKARRFVSADAARLLVERAGAVAAAAGFRALDWSELEADAARFRQVWRPIGILPPDQYLSVVLQLTQGCWFNRCTFCTFYRGQPFRVRPLDAFRRHIEEVKGFFGAGLARRHHLFLADANALVLPLRRLVPYLEAVAAAFPFSAAPVSAVPGGQADVAEPMDGVYAFLDAFSGRRKHPGEWRELADLHVRRAYIGLESGSDRLLRFLNKPGSAPDAVATVRGMRSAGIRVGVIIMVGVGGRAFAAEHVAETARALNAMQLDTGDILFLSPFIEPPDSEYARRAAAAGVVPLTPVEARAQVDDLLGRVRLGGGARWALYDIREFLY